jgi:hypothetical protein
VASNLRTLRVENFTGGLNYRTDVFHLDEGESPDMLNMDIDPRGGLRMRPGCRRSGNPVSTGSVHNITAYNTSTIIFAAVDFNTSIYSLYTSTNGASPTLLGGGVTFSNSTATRGKIFASWDAKDPTLYVARYDAAAYRSRSIGPGVLTISAAGAWQDSLSTPTGTHMPISKHVASHVDRLWVANTTEDGVAYLNRVRFSHPNFPESWRQIDYIDIIEGSGGITAIVPDGDRLLVFKPNSIHAIYGYDTDTFQVTKISDTLGASLGTHVARHIDGMVYFFSWPNGVFRIEGTGITDCFSRLRQAAEFGTMLGGDGGYTDVDLWSAGRRIWFNVDTAGGGNPSGTFVLHTDMAGQGSVGPWTRRRYQMTAGANSGVNSGPIVEIPSYGTSPQVFFGGRSLGIVLYRLDFSRQQGDTTAFQDYGTDNTPRNYASYFLTKWIDMGAISVRKMWRRPDYMFDQVKAQTALTIDAYQDWDESAPARTSSVVLAANATYTGTELKRGSQLGLAKSVALKITGPGGLYWALGAISFKYLPRRVR